MFMVVTEAQYSQTYLENCDPLVAKSSLIDSLLSLAVSVW